jgi:hypothetical protein
MVSKRLGVKFIWIDSLCIIQYSQEHWEWECSRMAAIYANAVATIFASDVPNPSVGFLREYNSGIKCNLWDSVQIRCIPAYATSPLFHDTPSLL